MTFLGEGAPTAMVLAYLSCMSDDPRPLAPTVASRPRLADQVLESLVERIASGEFLPGTSLPTEPEMLTHYGVSRGVAREAVKLLESRRMVVTRQGRRTTVLSPEEWDLLDPLVLSAAARHDDNNSLESEMGALRVALEPPAAAKAARRRSEADLAELRDLVAKMYHAVNDQAVFFELDFAFHLSILRSAGGRLVRQVISGLHSHVRQKYPSADVTSDELRRSADEHRMILDAIADGDGERSHELMRRHITDALERRIARAGSLQD